MADLKKFEDTAEVQLSVCILGDSGVGKSEIVKCLAEGVEAYRWKKQTLATTTIGVDFKVFDEHVDGVIVKIQLWDTAGAFHACTSLSHVRRRPGTLSHHYQSVHSEQGCHHLCLPNGVAREWGDAQFAGELEKLVQGHCSEASPRPFTGA